MRLFTSLASLILIDNMKTTIAGETLCLSAIYMGEQYAFRTSERHDTYKVCVRYNGKKTTFAYHDSLNNTYNKFPKELNERELKEAFFSSLSDAECYEDCTSFEDFCKSYGYDLYLPEDRSRGWQVYDACQYRNERYNSIFGKETWQKMYAELSEIF